jgi:predicted PurR-regulated permease PerM
MFLYTYSHKIIQIIIPFFLALIIAYLINPIVIRMESRKIPRMASILIIYTTFAIVVVSITIFIIPELINNIKELSAVIPDIASKYQNNFKWIISVIQSSSWPPDIKNMIFTEIQSGAGIAQKVVLDTLRKSFISMFETIVALFDLILAMIIAYYFIKDADFFKTTALSMTPRKWRNGIIRTMKEIHIILSGFIQGQLLTALIIGVMEIIGLSIVRVRYPLVLGLIGGITNIIPYFGPFLGAIPAIAIALIDSPMKAVWTIVVFVIIQQIDNAFISPKIIEGKLGLHPVTTILAVLIGGEFYGIIGMLISVPIMAIIKVILKRIVEAIV